MGYGYGCGERWVGVRGRVSVRVRVTAKALKAKGSLRTTVLVFSLAFVSPARCIVDTW